MTAESNASWEVKDKQNCFKALINVLTFIMLEIRFVALTNVAKHVMSNVAFVCSQQYTNNSVFWLVQMMLCIITLCDFPPFFYQTSFQMIRQMGCLYITFFTISRKNKCTSRLSSWAGVSAGGCWSSSSGRML